MRAAFGAAPGAAAHGGAPPLAPYRTIREEDAMILVIFDPRTGERVTLEVPDTPAGKRVIKPTRPRG
jgi:hypothetical protein